MPAAATRVEAQRSPARALQSSQDKRESTMKNSDLCVREVLVAPPATFVWSAAQRMGESAVGSLVVVDALRRPLGIVTDRDLVVRCLAPGKNPERTRLKDVMNGPPT